VTSIHVIATTLEGTRAALSAAVALARGSKANLVVLVPRVGLPDPEIEDDGIVAAASRYEQMARALGATARVEVCECRSLDDLVSRAVSAAAVIVMGGPAGRWLTSPEERFAGRLARAGCQVLFAASSANTSQRRVVFTSAAAL
jgi:hypothetical protein